MKPSVQDSFECSVYEEDGAAWDSLVSNAHGSTFCHLAGWRNVMTDVLGHECLFMAARDASGTCHGVLPLVRIRSRLFGHYLVSMPFLNYGGPLGTSAAQACLIESAVESAKQHRVDLLELRSRIAIACDLAVAHRKITVVLELTGTAEALWQGFPAKLRSQIRRPQKEGMETRFGRDQVGAFYDVFARNMRDLGTPVLPRKFFERMSQVFGDDVVYGVVYLKSQPVAGGCGFRWHDEFEMTWASSLREHNRLAPNMLLYWAFMERGIEQGVRVFNFGRCTPDGGTHRFKRQWGGEDVDLPWLQWSARGVASTPSPDRPVFRLATRAWGRMPLAVANRLGPILARKLP